MQTAKDFAKNEVEVELIATTYPEDVGIVPDTFTQTKPLERATTGFTKERKLPYFKEILDNLYETSDMDYFIQTNSDIGLQPYFYLAIKKLIDDGNDSFCVNKRILSEEFRELRDIPILWSIIGKEHAGHDCFVFKRELYPKFDIGEICTGTPWSETTLITNLVAYAKNFFVFKHSHLTFHIGDRRLWITKDLNSFRVHNTNEFAKVLRKLSIENPKILEHDTIKYLLKKLAIEVKGYKKESYSEDCIKLLN
jgi:hypothetical protein